MISTTRKYKSVEDFILGKKNYRKEKFSLVMNVCSAVEHVNSTFSIDDTCFYCNYCHHGDLKNVYKGKLDEIRSEFKSMMFFKKEMIVLPNSKFFITNPDNKNLYSFTSIEETKRIQLWATSILTNCSSDDIVSSIEIPAPNELFDRSGRIDIGVESFGDFLFIEAKTTLADAMSDERFVEQHAKYIPTIAKYLAPENYTLLILIGGNEQVLHPSGSKYNETDVGNLTKRFYKLIDDASNRIPFISAAALWALSLKNIEDPTFNIVEFLNGVFSNKNIYGLLTSGVVVKIGDRYEISEIYI